MGSERRLSGHSFPVGSVFRAALDAVIVMGADGRVRDWNPAAEEVFGYTWEEAVDHEVAELIIPGALRNVHRSGLAQLNDSVVRDPPLIPDQLVTVLFATASLHAGELVVVDLATAGHPSPVLARADGSVERIDVSGPLVGLTSKPGYEYRRARLAPGDALLLYTDGLTDARAPSRVLDDTGLAELLRRGSGLRGTELVEFLEATVTGEEDPRDDIAMLVVEVPRDQKVASQGELEQSSRPERSSAALRFGRSGFAFLLRFRPD